MPSSPLRVAVVCSSNQNRSMEAHNILSKRGFSVRSFGTGTHVKLPGPAPDKPNVYDFKTTYDQMYNDLLRKDKELYTQNGILHMLDRNKRIKPRPERFQNCRDLFDLILTCEERVYDQVVEDLNSREQETCQPVHVINVDIQDNHEEATLGAFLICELCQCIQHTEDMENEIDELLQEFEEKSGRAFLHTVFCWRTAAVPNKVYIRNEKIHVNTRLKTSPVCLSHVTYEWDVNDKSFLSLTKNVNNGL
ncbi:RNA polymerase II subunit A C-terminal domain phosphatase SSU72 isoform X1 [Hyaena hyaena]|uniref:RNA polymerase II subunit A C-terminal domain phosphatase SSU72 isoform X1 n=1 Tax=Hyaena hyaena TaxID=95912 RepID=UPI0019240AF3|nr:RNA polymerase II subunit A C-terminal domain phosphatase SSU72 isoform X1 [Hyaena hyaena]